MNYILDTNVLLEGLEDFIKLNSECGIIIPSIVLEELNHIKETREGKVAFKARRAMRALFEIKQYGNLNEWIKLDNEVSIHVHSKFDSGLNLGYSCNDDIIVGCVSDCKKEFKNVTLVSSDLNIILKAESFGFKSINFKYKNNMNKFYSGHIEIAVEDHIINDFYANNCIHWSNVLETEPYLNQCVTLTSNINPKRQALSINKDGMLCKLKYGDKTVFGETKGKNRQQKYLIEILMDDSIPIVAVNSELGTGKAQPLYSKVLTEKGWKTMGDINVGDKVFGRDGKLSNVLNIFPQGVKDNYRVIFNDGRIVECCDEHLWTYSTKSQKYTNTESTNTLRHIIEKYKYNTETPNNIWIKNIKPIEYKEKEYEIAPYLLGVLLGDGYLPKVGSICISTNEKDIVENVSKLLPKEFKIKKQKGENFTYPITSVDGLHYKKKDRHIKNMIEDLELLGLKSHEKFIPTEYLLGSVKQRLDLLKGLIDTDGCLDTKFRIRYSTTSEKLKNSVIELCNSLGIQVRTSIDSREGRRDCYELRLITKDIVFSSKKHSDKYEYYKENINNKYTRKNLYTQISKIEYIGKCEMQCLMVDNNDKIYITDGYIPTHNSFISTAVGLQKVLEDGAYDRILYVKPMEAMGGKEIGFLPSDKNSKLLGGYSGTIVNILENIFSKREKQYSKLSYVDDLIEKGYLQVEAMTFMRGMSYFKTFMIIDEAANINKLDIKNILGRCGEGSKCCVIGSSNQLDNQKLTELDNGLQHVIENLKGSKLFGTIRLDKPVRSEVAQLVVDKL